MKIKNFKRYFPDATANSYAKRLSNEQWAQLRPWLTQLHEQGFTRSQIVEEVDHEQGVHITQGQLNRKFKDWDLKVYNKPGLSPFTQANITNPDLSTVAGAESITTEPSLTSGQDTLSDSNQEQAQIPIDQRLVDNRDVDLHPVYANDIDPVELPTRFQSNGIQDTHHECMSFYPSTSVIEDAVAQWIINSAGPLPNAASQSSMSLDDDQASVLSYSVDEERICDTSGEVGGETAASLFFNKLEYEPREASLQAIIGLAAFYRSTRLFKHAYFMYKKLYQIFLANSPRDDVYKVGALINCARLVSGHDETEYVSSELSATLSWFDVHWSSHRHISGRALHDYMSALRIALLKQPKALALTSIPIGNFETFPKELVAFYTALKGVGFAAQQIFAHVAALNYGGDPASCAKLLENFSKYIRWGLVWTRVNAYSFETDFIKCLSGETNDRWHLIRSMVIHLISPASRKNLSTFQESTLRCDCSFCPVTLTGDDLGNVEESTALANTIVTQVLGCLKIPKAEENVAIPSYYGISPVQHAIDEVLAKNFSSPSFNGSCRDLLVVQDFLAHYRSCFEASFMMKGKISLSVSEAIVERAERTICNNSGLNWKNYGQAAGGRRVSLPAGHWLARLVNRSRNTDGVAEPTDAMKLKRNRSAVSSMLNSKFSRSSSLRSFEHMAKRLRQQSRGSHRSGTSTWSRSSSHASLRFETVTNLMPLPVSPELDIGEQTIREDDEAEEYWEGEDDTQANKISAEVDYALPATGNMPPGDPDDRSCMHIVEHTHLDNSSNVSGCVSIMLPSPVAELEILGDLKLQEKTA